MDDLLREIIARHYAETGARLGFWPREPATPPPPAPETTTKGRMPAGPRGPARAPVDFLRAVAKRTRRY